MTDYIILKWGTLKGWSISDEKCLAILLNYIDCGVSMSTLYQEDTEQQKELLFQLIDNHKGEIINDYDGKKYNQQQAKDYINNYKALA